MTRKNPPKKTKRPTEKPNAPLSPELAIGGLFDGASEVAGAPVRRVHWGVDGSWDDGSKPRHRRGTPPWERGGLHVPR